MTHLCKHPLSSFLILLLTCLYHVVGRQRVERRHLVLLMVRVIYVRLWRGGEGREGRGGEGRGGEGGDMVVIGTLLSR